MAWPTVRPAQSGRTLGTAAFPRGSSLVGLGMLLAAVLVSCQSADPARAGAEGFIDRYYVEIDVPEARKHATGLALDKLDRELELLEGLDAPESGGKPQVNYRFLTERAGADAGHRGFLYELTISFAEGDPVVRRALVTVREDAGEWRVANFQELD